MTGRNGRTRPAAYGRVDVNGARSGTSALEDDPSRLLCPRGLVGVATGDVGMVQPDRLQSALLRHLVRGHGCHYPAFTQLRQLRDAFCRTTYPAPLFFAIRLPIHTHTHTYTYCNAHACHYYLAHYIH